MLLDAAKKSRDFERQDTRAEADKALADLKAKGMQVNELPAAEASRMREKLAAVNAACRQRGRGPVEGRAGRRGAGTRGEVPGVRPVGAGCW